MSGFERDELIYDWNRVHDDGLTLVAEPMFVDETLRDGLQSPSVRDQELDEKVRLIRLMDKLGIDSADVGLPGAGTRAREHIRTLCREMRALSIRPNVACRTVISDIAPVVDLVQELGHPVETCTFIGSSPIRQYAEGWKLEEMIELTKKAVSFAVDHDLPCMFVT